MIEVDSRDRENTPETGREGTLTHGAHRSPKRADEQDFPPEERPTTPIEEAGERKGDEAGDGGTPRRGP